MTKEIEINYANVWSFLLNKGEAYVIRAEEFQPGEYICRHETESVQCIVDKVIEANPLVIERVRKQERVFLFGRMDE
jgi:hypothetical protein